MRFAHHRARAANNQQPIAPGGGHPVSARRSSWVETWRPRSGGGTSQIQMAARYRAAADVISATVNNWREPATLAVTCKQRPLRRHEIRAICMQYMLFDSVWPTRVCADSSRQHIRPYRHRGLGKSRRSSEALITRCGKQITPTDGKKKCGSVWFYLKAVSWFYIKVVSFHTLHPV